ncbi:hypothetical protein BDF21DRAFT_358265 [Thamnidium elegans]|nr:hypothetical protein BDF21DRAFT_358265 [Thamnidium elegans]
MNLSYSNLYKHASYQAKISPNGHYVANGLDNRLVIRDHSDELTVLMVYETPKPIDYIEWSPNSEYILTCNYEAGRIDIRSTIDTNWHGIIKEGRISMTKVSWSFDSKKVLYITELKLMLGIWDLSTSELTYINHIKYTEKGIETSPDGSYVAVARKDSGKDYISIYYGGSFTQLEHFEAGTVDLQNLKWSPDGIFIAIWDSCLYHNLLVYRQDGTLCVNYSGYEYGLGIKTVCWSPNGQLLAIGNYDQTIHLLSTKDWKLVSILNHPTTLTSSMNTKVLEELIPVPTTGLNQKKEADYQILTKRPYNISALRAEYNQPNPKVGIGLCQFSVDSSYICSRNDNTPNVLWTWEVKSLRCNTIVKFNHSIRQALWNPLEEHMLVVICGDEKTRYLQPTEDEGMDIVSFSVPISDFSIKKSKWNLNGDSLILMDTNLFCLAVM